MGNPHKPININILLNDDIFNGLMLSDGYLIGVKPNKGNSRFMLSQKESHREIVDFTSNYFMDLGINHSIRKMLEHEKYWQVKLSTEKNTTFTELRKFWYPEGIKIVPQSLKLTPRMISFWFMGDGNSQRTSFYKGYKRSVQITLFTDGFDKESVEFLANQLKTRFNLPFTVWNRYKKYWTLRTTKNTTTERFMNLIEPFILPCFKYKIKHLAKFQYHKKINN